MAHDKKIRRQKIKESIRSRVSGTADMPRLSVFRSNKQISVQLIDDVAGVTLASATSLEKSIAEFKGNKTQKADKVGELIAKVALDKNITQVVFDRNGFLYHGRVKSLADAARKGGLKF
jgi:large subunit ribosomal protein L18